ncbi:MAG: hypothetical protein IK062_00335 [Selenomonadaceae bacterium]|nr:hypothetical protein [Selenomonadaceae bacterium]
MQFSVLSVNEMTVSFFKNVVFAVWNTYECADYFQFLHVDGSLYKSNHPKKLDRVFPVVKNLRWSERGWENWTWYYMGMGGGAVFVRNDFLETYKVHAKINDKYIEHFPNWKAAISALNEIIEKGLITIPKKKNLTEEENAEILRKEREERFTWQPGDLTFFSSREEVEKAAAKEGKTVVWYD